MNVLELHARHRPRWNGDEWWKPDDFLWKVDWKAENLTTKIDRERDPRTIIMKCSGRVVHIITWIP